MSLINLKERPTRKAASRRLVPGPVAPGPVVPEPKRPEPPRHSLPVTSGRSWSEHHARTEIGRVARTEEGWMAFVPDGPGFRVVGPFPGFPEALAVIPDAAPAAPDGVPAMVSKPETKPVARPATRRRTPPTAHNG